MANRILIGVAGAALVAATGAAHAVDAPGGPTAVAPIAPVAFAGPVTAIQLDTTLRTRFFLPGGDSDGFDWESDVVIDFQRPTGWSFQILGILDFTNWNPFSFDFDLAARTYRSFGDLTVGAFAGIEGEWSDTFYLYDRSLGFDIEFHAGNFAVYSKHWIDFESGGFEDFSTNAWVTFDVGERLTLGGGIDNLEFDTGGFDCCIQVEAWASLGLGIFTPYAFVEWTPGDSDFNGGLGVDFERQIGTGPASLIGNAEVVFRNSGANLDVIIGIRFNRGEVNAPWWWKPLGLNGLDNNSI